MRKNNTSREIIPYNTLARQYEDYKHDLDEAFFEVMAGGKYTLGPRLAQFEEEFARYCGSKFAVGISTGTEALHLALRALNIGPGDEVLTPANTYIATVFAISYVGATPVLVDIDPETYTIDIDELADRVTTRSRAVIPVHLYGQPADMSSIVNIARENDMRVVEDVAQAHGAKIFDQPVGSLGDIGCFSFYPNKNLGAFGDGGAIVTNNQGLYHKVRVLRYMGQEEKYHHLQIGYNQRLDEIQAALLSVKLKHLDQWNKRRQEIAAYYDERLPRRVVKAPSVLEGRTHVYYTYTIRAHRRDELRAWLQEKGIGTAIIYPIPIHLQPAYSHLGQKVGDFPETERACRETLCLPIYPELRDTEIMAIVEAVRDFYEKIGTGDY